MPYIKKESRPYYDDIISEIVKNIENACDADLSMWASKFKSGVLGLSNNGKLEENVDGEFNYFLTKLFKSLGWLNGMTYYSYEKSADKIKKLVLECMTVYTDVVKSYFNYNRAMGMLTCCQEELKRRYKNDASLGRIFLEIIKKKYYEEISVYEDTKILANGDV